MLDEAMSKLASMTTNGRTAETRRLADMHDGVVPHQHGVLPFHHKVIEPMHATHNEFNVLLDEAVHQHLLVQSSDPKVKEEVLKATRDINALWGSVHMQKRLYYGRDGDGTPQPAPAVNGPDMKVILRHPTLLPKTVDIMMPVWALTEAEREKSSTQPSTEAPAPKQPAKKRGRGASKQPSKKGKRAKKTYAARFEQVGCDDDSDSDVPDVPQEEEESNQPSTSGDAEGQQASSQETNQPSATRPTASRALETDSVPKSSKSAADSLGCSTATATYGAAETTYAQRVAQAFSKFIDFYEYLHRNHEEKASLYPRSTEAGRAERARRADEAVKRVVAFERAAIALIGEHRRRAYAHDLVYGMHKLYELFGKPWNGACEGSEHAHQEVKRFFAKLTCHSSAHAEKHSGACHQILKMSIIKQQLCRERAVQDLPASEYSAQRANTTFSVAVKQKVGRRNGKNQYKKSVKTVGAKETKYATTAESKMLVVRDNIKAYC